MWKMFTVNNNTVYWDKIDNIVNNYTNFFETFKY